MVKSTAKPCMGLDDACGNDFGSCEMCASVFLFVHSRAQNHAIATRAMRESPLHNARRSSALTISMMRAAMPHIRPNILARDSHRCLMCGYGEVLDVHHILPLSRGGTNYEHNLVTLCANCHRLAHRGTITPAQMRDALAWELAQGVTERMYDGQFDYDVLREMGAVH